MQPKPDIATLLKIAQSPAGQQLLSILQADPSVDLNSIAAAAACGNLDAVRQTFSSLLSSKESLDLLKQLEKQL